MLKALSIVLQLLTLAQGPGFQSLMSECGTNMLDLNTIKKHEVSSKESMLSNFYCCLV